MTKKQTLIGVQDAYIKTVLKAKLKTRAMVRGAARARMTRALGALGFNFNQVQDAANDAREMADLELLCRKVR